MKVYVNGQMFDAEERAVFLVFGSDQERKVLAKQLTTMGSGNGIRMFATYPKHMYAATIMSIANEILDLHNVPQKDRAEYLKNQAKPMYAQGPEAFKKDLIGDRPLPQSVSSLPIYENRYFQYNGYTYWWEMQYLTSKSIVIDNPFIDSPIFTKFTEGIHSKDVKYYVLLKTDDPAFADELSITFVRGDVTFQPYEESTGRKFIAQTHSIAQELKTASQYGITHLQPRQAGKTLSIANERLAAYVEGLKALNKKYKVVIEVRQPNSLLSQPVTLSISGYKLDIDLLQVNYRPNK